MLQVTNGGNLRAALCGYFRLSARHCSTIRWQTVTGSTADPWADLPDSITVWQKWIDEG